VGFVFLDGGDGKGMWIGGGRFMNEAGLFWDGLSKGV
jgi:hypothetical protein